jgi:hypothetical protein
VEDASTQAYSTAKSHPFESGLSVMLLWPCTSPSFVGPVLTSKLTMGERYATTAFAARSAMHIAFSRFG